MIDAVNGSYRFLSERFDSPHGDAVIEALKIRDPLPHWNDPGFDGLSHTAISEYLDSGGRTG